MTAHSAASGGPSAREAHMELNMIQAAQVVIKQHAASMCPNIHSRDTQILERCVTSYHKRFFMELWHFTLCNDTINEGKFTAFHLHV